MTLMSFELSLVTVMMNEQLIAFSLDRTLIGAANGEVVSDGVSSSSSTPPSTAIPVSPFSAGSSGKYTVSMKENTVIFETNPTTLVHESPRVVTSSPLPTTPSEILNHSRGDFDSNAEELHGGGSSHLIFLAIRTFEGS